MVASEIRQEAQKRLSGKWGKAAVITLIYLLITMAITFLINMIIIVPFLGFLLMLAIYAVTIPLYFGVLISFLKLSRNEEIDYADFLTIGFKDFKRLWCVVGNTLLKLIIPIVGVMVSIFILLLGTGAMAFSIALHSSAFFTIFASLFFIIGISLYLTSLVFLIIKGLSYSLSYFILHDRPDLSNKEIVEESAKLMEGHRGSLFYLGLTFIGWAILSVLTLGIGYLWLLPYIFVSIAVFYETRVGSLESSKVQKESNTTTSQEPALENHSVEVVKEETTPEEVVEKEVEIISEEKENDENREEIVDEETTEVKADSENTDKKEE